MIKQLTARIEELINDCPNDWATKAASKMEKSEDYVRKVRHGKLGVRNCEPQMQLIQALKEVKEEYQTSINAAL